MDASDSATKLHRKRRRFIIMAVVCGIFTASLVTFFLLQGQSLRDRLGRIAVGMTRPQVEAVFGPPVLTLPKAAPAKGELLVWVDQLWQIDVTIGADGRVIRCGCIPSDSAVRRMQSWTNSLLQ